MYSPMTKLVKAYGLETYHIFELSTVIAVRFLHIFALVCVRLLHFGPFQFFLVPFMDKIGFSEEELSVET